MELSLVSLSREEGAVAGVLEMWSCEDGTHIFLILVFFDRLVGDLVWSTSLPPRRSSYCKSLQLNPPRTALSLVALKNDYSSRSSRAPVVQEARYLSPNADLLATRSYDMLRLLTGSRNLNSARDFWN